jgi:hypothetical protein
MSMRCEIQQRRLLVVLVKRLMPNHLKPWPQPVESDVMPIFKEVMLCICINGQHVMTPQPKLTCYVQRGPRFVGPTFWYTDRYDKRSGKRRQIATHDHRGILSSPSRCKHRGLKKQSDIVISITLPTVPQPLLTILYGQGLYIRTDTLGRIRSDNTHHSIGESIVRTTSTHAARLDQQTIP